jgi:ribosomal-protein-alanine N-acetyltransferase
MREPVLRPADDADVGRIERVLVASRVFPDSEAVRAVVADAPWRIQLNGAGDLAVVDRWRDHLDLLGVELLICPQSSISRVMQHLRQVAVSRGLGDVLSQPVPVEETREYEAAGMRICEVIVTLSLSARAMRDRPLALPVGFVLRPWTPADTPALIEADAQCFEPLWRYDARHSDRLGATGRLVLAERDGRIVGYTLSTVERGEGTLGRVCVVPAERRRGLGTALAADAVASMRDGGAERIVLCTQHDNTRSLELYRRLGFRDTGRRHALLRFDDPHRDRGV